MRARALDFCRKDVRRQRVHRESSGVTFGCRAAGRNAVDTGVVDDGIHSADGVDLFGELVGLCGTAEVADHHAKRLRGKIADRFGAGSRARMQQDLVALVDKGPRCSQAQAIRAAGYEHTTQISSLSDIARPKHAPSSPPSCHPFSPEWRCVSWRWLGRRRASASRRVQTR